MRKTGPIKKSLIACTHGSRLKWTDWVRGCQKGKFARSLPVGAGLPRTYRLGTPWCRWISRR